MRYFGYLTRAATVWVGVQLMMAAFCGLGTDGLQPGPVVVLLFGGLLTTAPIIEHGLRQRAATLHRH